MTEIYRKVCITRIENFSSPRWLALHWAGADKEDSKPSLLSLPVEIRTQIFQYMFISRQIRFFPSSTYTLDSPEKVDQPRNTWSLTFLQTNQQIYHEGWEALRSVIRDSILIFDGMVPQTELQQGRIDRYLFTRQMLDLFLQQYADDIRSIACVNIPKPEFDLRYFDNLKKVTVEVPIFTAFQVTYLNESGATKASFPDFEPGATREQVATALLRRWLELNAVESSEIRSATCNSMIRLAWRMQKRAKLHVLVLLKTVAASSIRFGSSRSTSTGIKLLIDTRNDTILEYNGRKFDHSELSPDIPLPCQEQNFLDAAQFPAILK